VELRWLATFVAVAEELNFRRAAERLFVAQPAVSQQIMNLERELGVRLFDRNKRSVRLTDAGTAFLAPCRQALAGVDNAGRLARNAGTGEYGTIRLGFNAGFATDHLVILARMLGREHPHLELVFDSSRATPDILAMLRDDRLDIGLVGGPAAGVGLRRRRIGATSLGVLLPQSHALAPADPVPVRQLADEHLVLVEAAPGWSLRALVQAALDRAGVAPAGVTTVADGMTMLSFVAAGIGVGFASMNTSSVIPHGMTLRPLDDARETPTSAVWKQANETPALRTVIGAIDRHLIDATGAGPAGSG
jgi:DNA-binding transcriptional LysR family regulator